MANRVTAVFDSETQAEKAVRELRQRGLRDDALSVMTKRRGETVTHGEGSAAMPAAEEGDTTLERTGKGALAGAGAGAIFGLAAALIPGIGPFITAGWLATVLGTTAGAAVSGAVVGGTAGAVAGALAKAGYDEDEARFYGEAVERGDVLVAIDMADTDIARDEVRDILARHGGRFGGEARQARAA